jgi:hypothetical protein
VFLGCYPMRWLLTRTLLHDWAVCVELVLLLPAAGDSSSELQACHCLRSSGILDVQVSFGVAAGACTPLCRHAARIDCVCCSAQVL